MSSKRPAAGEPLSFGRTLLTALAIECGVLLAAGSLMASAAAQARHDDPPMLMVVEAPAPETPKEEPKPPPKPVVHPVPVKTAQHIMPLPTPEPPTPAPTPTDSPIVETPPPPPPAPAPSSSIDKEIEFAARLKAAIQAAVAYPPAARSMGFRGKTRVEFVFRDGSTHQVRVIQGSGIGIIDNAALAAVANANYPQAPETLKGKDMLYQVTVTFDFSAIR